MIDLETGSVVLDGSGAGATTVGPSLSLSAFLASPLARGAMSFGVAVEWPCYHVGQHEVFGDPCAVALMFHGQQLDWVMLCPIAPAPPGDAGVAYDVDATLAVKARHDEWLAAKLGPPTSPARGPVWSPLGTVAYDYPWGCIWSRYTPQDVSSMIGISYARPRKRR